MSANGVAGACVLFVAFLAFVGLAIAYDVYLRRKGGDDATITYGVRWLGRHMPWTTHAVAFALGALLGFLLAHFFAVPIVQ